MTRNTCKLILVLLACAAPLVAAVVGAEPNSGGAPGAPACGSRVDGELYAAAAADQGTRQPVPSADNQPQGALTSPESPSQPATHRDEAKRSEAGGVSGAPGAPTRSEGSGSRVGEKPAAPAEAVGLGAEERPSGSVQSLSNIERGWILIVAGLGLLLSLAAAAYLAWSRARQIEAPVSVLLPRGLPQASNNPSGRPAADEQARPERRAA